jgi:hypothetical protein
MLGQHSFIRIKSLLKIEQVARTDKANPFVPWSNKCTIAARIAA